MGKPIKCLLGKKFNRLTVIGDGVKKRGRAHWECKCLCGNITFVPAFKLESGSTKSCGCLKSEKSRDRMKILGDKWGKINGKIKDTKKEKHWKWKGGKTTHKGYVMILTKDNNYKREHRLIMENYLGRNLSNIEVVHHINGVKTDNKLKNLMLFKNQSEHINYHLSKK